MASLNQGLPHTPSEDNSNSLTKEMLHRAQCFLSPGWIMVSAEKLEPIIIQRLLREYTRLEFLLQGNELSELFIYYIQDFLEWEISDQQCLELELTEEKALLYLETIIPIAQKKYSSKVQNTKDLSDLFGNIVEAMANLFKIAGATQLNGASLWQHVLKIFETTANQSASQVNNSAVINSEILPSGSKDNISNQNVSEKSSIKEGLSSSSQSKQSSMESTSKKLGSPVLGHSSVQITSNQAEIAEEVMDIDAPVSSGLVPASSLSSSQINPLDLIEQTQSFENSQEVVPSTADESQSFPKSHQPKIVIQTQSSGASNQSEIGTSRDPILDKSQYLTSTDNKLLGDDLESQPNKDKNQNTTIDDHGLLHLFSQLPPINEYLQKVSEFQDSLAALEKKTSGTITNYELKEVITKIDERFLEIKLSTKILSEYLDRRINGVLESIQAVSTKADDKFSIENRLFQITTGLQKLAGSVTSLNNLKDILKNSQTELEQRLNRIENQTHLLSNSNEFNTKAEIQWKQSDFDKIKNLTDENVHPKLAQIQHDLSILAKVLNQFMNRATENISKSFSETNRINQTLLELNNRINNVQKTVDAVNIGERLKSYDETILLLDYNQLKVMEKLEENEILHNKIDVLEKQQLSQKQEFEDLLRVQFELYSGKIETLDQTLRQSQETNRYISQLLLIHEKKFKDYESRLNLGSSNKPAPSNILENLSTMHQPGHNLQLQTSSLPEPPSPINTLKRPKLINSPNLAAFQAPPLKKFKLFKGLNSGSKNSNDKEDTIVSSPATQKPQNLSNAHYDPSQLTPSQILPSTSTQPVQIPNTNSPNDGVSIEDSIVINSSDEEN